MKLDTIIQKNSAIFSFLVSGISFFGLYTETDNVFSAAVFTLITLTAVLFAFCICEKLLYKAVYTKGIAKMPIWAEVALCLVGFCACILFYAAFTYEFSNTVPVISGEFEGGRFSALFVVISTCLALYMGKREVTSLSRTAVLLLPVILLPYILTAFDFLGHTPDILQLVPKRKIDFDIKYILHPLCLFGGSVAIFPLVNGENSAVISKKRRLFDCFWAFLGAFVFCFIEYFKYILWFGQDGIAYVLRPDRTMLSQVPFMNVQELHIISYYSSYMLAISLFCTCARKYFEKLLTKTGIDEGGAIRLSYIATGCFSLISYYAFKLMGKGSDSVLIIPYASCTVLAVIILQTVAKTVLKRQNAKK